MGHQRDTSTKPQEAPQEEIRSSGQAEASDPEDQPTGRKRIAAAQRECWAKVKAQQKKQRGRS